MTSLRVYNHGLTLLTCWKVDKCMGYSSAGSTDSLFRMVNTMGKTHDGTLKRYCSPSATRHLLLARAGRNEHIFMGGHSAGGQVAEDYALKKTGGLILLVSCSFRHSKQQPITHKSAGPLSNAPLAEEAVDSWRST